jgi:hypothetical protein
MNQPLILTAGEKMDPLWRKLTDHWTERLAALRAQNENNLGPDETAILRGRIKELKANLALATDSPVVE